MKLLLLIRLNKRLKVYIAFKFIHLRLSQMSKNYPKKVFGSREESEVAGFFVFSQ